MLALIGILLVWQNLRESTCIASLLRSIVTHGDNDCMYIIWLFPSSRPDTAFLWFMNPFKTLKYIIWKNYKWTILKVFLFLLLVAFISLMIYTVPGATVNKIFGTWGLMRIMALAAYRNLVYLMIGLIVCRSNLCKVFVSDYWLVLGRFQFNCIRLSLYIYIYIYISINLSLIKQLFIQCVCCV